MTTLPNWLHRVRSYVVPAALAGAIVLAGALALPGPASAVMVSRPPAPMVAAYQQAQRRHDTAADAAAAAAARAARAAQAASAMAELKALLAVPPPAAPPTVALTPAAPSPSSPTAAAVVPTPVPAPSALPATAGLPARGRATAFGCPAAMAYLKAYAAPDFIIACGIDRHEHQATTTCISGRSPCSLGRFILIADPCAAAYMNEASNSWVLMGLSDAPIDPYGSCP